MIDVKQFFIAKLPELLPCQEGTAPLLGGLALSASYRLEKGDIDASQYLLTEGGAAGNSAAISGSFISILNKNISTVFTRRIKETPFYISYLAAENLVIYQLDFYNWAPQTSLYRLIHIENHHGTLPFQCRFVNMQPAEESHTIRWGACQVAWQTDSPYEWNVDKLSISPDSTGFSSSNLSLVISSQHLQPDSQSAASLIKTYFELETRARAAHICHCVKAQDRAIEQQLDNDWVRIQAITPEGQMDPSVETMTKLTDSVRWSIEICKILGKQKPSQDYLRGVIPAGGRSEQESFYRQVWQVYLFEKPPTAQFISRLQSWWNRYSLPVFEKKMQAYLRDRPEILLMIYALAQRFRMIWHQNLLDRCRHFIDRPELSMLASLASLVSVHAEKGGVNEVYRGARQAGNSLTFRWHSGKIRYTRFSRRSFSEIQLENRQICKIDKEVNFRLDERKKKLQIFPSIIPVHDKDWQKNQLELKINETHLTIPLIWRQMELYFLDFRLRWILKKDRFQLTCKAGKTIHHIEMNGEALPVDQMRLLKKYLPVKKTKVSAEIRLLDGQGRTVLLPEQNDPQKVIVCGWILDQYGVFPGHLNIIEGKKQTICTINESGNIEQTINLKSRSSHVTLVIKQYHQLYHLSWITGHALLNFLSFSPVRNPGNLLVLLSPALLRDFNRIKSQLIETLGFLPTIELLTEGTRLTPSAPVLYLSVSADKYPCTLKKLNPIALKTGEKYKDLFAEIVPVTVKKANNE